MSKKVLKTVIVEDSLTQLTIIRNLVNKHRNLSLIGEYQNGISALNELQKHKVDLVLLDIEMPIVNGFDLLESLEWHPQVIIVSTKEEYALKAFDYNITDYLKKPISLERFNIAIKRVIKGHNHIKLKNDDKLFIYLNDNLQKDKIYLNSIKWVEALGDYIKIVTTDESHLMLSTMKAFMLRLPKKDFVRIHKSFIVNTNRIENWCSTNVVIDGKQLPMSRTKKDDLENLLLAY